MKPNRFHICATATPNSKTQRDLRSRYNIGEYQPGKDKMLYLCEQCPLPDCIRGEGDFQNSGSSYDYPGCLIWEMAKANESHDTEAITA